MVLRWLTLWWGGAADVIRELEVQATGHIRLAWDDLDGFIKDEVSLDLLIDGISIFCDSVNDALKKLKKLQE